MRRSFRASPRITKVQPPLHHLTQTPSFFKNGIRQRLSLLAFLLLASGCSTAPPPTSATAELPSKQSQNVAPPQPKVSPHTSIPTSKNSATATAALSHQETPDEQETPTPDPPAPLAVDFEGRSQVSYREFVDELRKVADELIEDAEVQKAHAQLLQDKDLNEKELPLESFSRVRLVFESTRDSGLWGIRGNITDEMPWSDKIWQQWGQRSFAIEGPLSLQDRAAASGTIEFPTAEGECDELGALFSILARDLGIVGFVGLHWPYWNHVVPIWQVSREDGSFVRIIAPATQNFLSSSATLGTTELETRKIVFPYSRHDQKADAQLSVDLARYLLHQSRTHGGLSTQELTKRRLQHRWDHRPNTSQ